ncbi:MAG TPA: hypothetical protein VHZ98_09490 [Galbitalea sp.]|jgi:hypothetical protein|nr:hypothetical protein [Galbitalea sp.]
MVDIAWQGVPNWIVAIASVLTLGAAITAGVFAGKAAHWTKEQAESSKKQVQIANDALVIAQQEAEVAQNALRLEQLETERANRRLDESRLDALAPTIYARATLGTSDDATKYLLVRHRVSETEQQPDWEKVEAPFELASDEGAAFRTTLTITFTNVSERLALIDITDPVNGEMDLRQGTSIVIPPHDTRAVVWTRTFSSYALADDAGINKPEYWLFDLTFWARDLGMNVRDAYKFNGDLRFFERDGTRLIVKTEPPFPWTENIAVPLPGRVSERLDTPASP